MDTSRVTTGQLAKRLRTSLPRVHRAAEQLSQSPERTIGGHRRLSAQQADELTLRLGYQGTVVNRSREETFVLAALSRRPLGLRSVRAVARAAGISPTTAGRVVAKLESEGLVERKDLRVVEGVPRSLSVWRINAESKRWAQIAPSVRRVRPPQDTSRPMGGKVPRRYRHLFWNVDAAALSTTTDGSFIAGRILQSNDAMALGWMARNIDRNDIARASRTRGLDASSRAFAQNLVRAA
jgi:hypothetical protein